jgi:hypothetical protein
MRRKWTVREINNAKRVLGKHTSVGAAAQELGCSHTAVHLAFLNRGLAAGSFVKNDPTDTTRLRATLQTQAQAKAVKVLQRRLLQAEETQDFYDKIGSAPPIKVRTGSPKSGLRQGTICSVASDWHVGEVVSLEETHGTNEYNLAIARKRAEKYWDNIIWLRKDITRTVDSPDHVLSLNGDGISGSIHEELSESNEVGLVEQVEQYLALTEPGIRALASRVAGRLIIPCVHGNHSRMNKGRSMVKIGWTVSLEALGYRWLRDRLKDVPNIEWIIPKAESVSLDILGHRVRFQHGTHIRSQGGIGGILVPLTRWAIRQNTADLYVFGHFHQASAFGRVIVNGSNIGESAYTVENGFEARPPEQVNFVLDTQHGLRRFDPVSVA